MASFGHIALGLAAGRIYCAKGASRRSLLTAMGVFSALSLAPDLDVVSFALGIPYSAVLGHRGATHSIGAAVLAGAIAWVVCRPAPWRATLLTTLVVLSHALLDTLTNGGLGCALFWPFSNERFFAPVTPIPVAPIGLGMLSERGFLVLVVELLMFLPVVIYATFPRRRAG
jgi:inner membrane protein